MKKAKIKNLEVDVDRIHNLKLRRIINERCREFMFNYGDKYQESEHHKDSSGHTDHDGYRDAQYSESSTHTDRISDKDNSGSYHKDYTDKGHTDYNDHSEAYSDYFERNP